MLIFNASYPCCGGFNPFARFISTDSYTETGALQSTYSGVAFNPSGSYIYGYNVSVSEGDQDIASIDIINVSTNLVVNTITINSNCSDGCLYDQGVQPLVFQKGNLYVTTAYNVLIFNLSSGSLVKSLSAGGATILSGVKINPQGTLAYVAGVGMPGFGPEMGEFETIDIATDTVLNTIALGSEPDIMDINPSGTLAYVPVSNGSVGEVDVVNLDSDTVTNTIAINSSVQPFFSQLLINPAGTFAYLDCYSPAETIYIIDLSNNTLLPETLSSGIVSSAWGFSFSGMDIYMMLNGSSTGAQTSSTTTTSTTTINYEGIGVINTIALGNDGPMGVAYNPDNEYMYVAASYNTKADVISGNTLLTTVQVGSSPGRIAYNPSNGYMYVTNLASGTVNVISGISEAGNPITVGAFPTGVAYDSGDGYIYVANDGDGTVSVISGITVIATIPVDPAVSAYTSDVAYDPDNGYIYVTDQYDSNVTVISGTSVVEQFTMENVANGGPIAYDPSNGYMYVVNHGEGTVTVISGTSEVGSPITVGWSPEGIAYDPSNDNMYVTSWGSFVGKPGIVDIISGTSVEGSPVTVGINPIGVAYNPSNGYMYVTNYGSGTVSVLS